MNDRHGRLKQLLELVAREDQHLLGVRQRLLDNDCQVDSIRMRKLLETEAGIDRLESFGSKFGRMQDTVVDKLIPAILYAAGEPVLAAIDNLGKMERLELINSADTWLEMRRLRNRLVHEYFENPDDLAPGLQRACEFTDTMHTDFERMKDYIHKHLG